MSLCCLNGETQRHLPTHRRVVAAASRQDRCADGGQMWVTQSQRVFDLLLRAGRHDDRTGVTEQHRQKQCRLAGEVTSHGH